LSVVCIAAQFSFTKAYQKKYVAGLLSALAFQAIVAPAGAAFLICANGFKLSVSAFSTAMALAMAVINVSSALASIYAIKFGKLSVYTTFMMLGGMTLPFAYGVAALSERPTAAQAAGLFVLVVSLFIPFAGRLNDNARGENTGAFILLCAAVFALNGCVSVLSKAHQIDARAADTLSFMILTNAFSSVFSAAAITAYLLGFKGDKNAAPKPIRGSILTVKSAKQAGLAAAVSVIGCSGYMLQLSAAKNMPATALYPMVTGGTIVMTSAAGRVFFGERIPWRLRAGIALSIVGTFMISFR